MSLTIWTNHVFRPEVLEEFQQGIAAAGHRLLVSPKASAVVLAAGGPDPALEQADVAFGQPEVAQAMACPSLKFIELSIGDGEHGDANVRQRGRWRGLTHDESVPPVVPPLRAARARTYSRLGSLHHSNRQRRTFQRNCHTPSLRFVHDPTPTPSHRQPPLRPHGPLHARSPAIATRPTSDARMSDVCRRARHARREG